MKQQEFDIETSQNGKQAKERRSQRPADSDTSSAVIPRNRDKHRNPMPRRIVHTPPLVSLAEQELIETAEAFSRSPEEGARSMPLLYSKNAIVSKHKARELEENLIAAREERNRDAMAALEKLEPQFESALTAEERRSAAAARACAEAIVPFKMDADTLSFAPNEPATLEEIAGLHGLLAPEHKLGWWNKVGYKLLAVIGGGALFGLSIGGLVAELDFANLAQKWFEAILWMSVGMVIVALMGALLYPIAKPLGNELYNRGMQLPWLRWANLVCALLLIGSIAYALIRIESEVEKQGLFSAINASKSMAASEVSEEDLGWIALMLVFPVVFLYINLGLAEGIRAANLCRLQALHYQMREAIITRPGYAAAVQRHNEYRSALKRRERIEAKIAKHESQIRHELNDEERYRVEDVQHDMIGQDLMVQEWMVAVAASQGYGPRGLWRRIRSWFAER